MVNVGLNLSSLIGLIQIIGAVIYFSISIAQVVIVIRNTGTLIQIAIQVLQILFGPAILLISGGILLFQGWRLDPILAFQQVIITGLLIYLIIRDWQYQR
ncbi:MAG TPA: hypothetical protein DCQ51_12075 [Planktothrix sp. UBA8407]|jgi:hypothetical protein|nr:hypothetical protein [Planktothrix sp. UBA8407]HBK24418.1 hypothetical protein [Planktothrix sp. UBA10369]